MTSDQINATDSYALTLLRWKLANLDENALTVFRVRAELLNEDVQVALLVERTGLSEAAVRKALNAIREQGL